MSDRSGSTPGFSATVPPPGPDDPRLAALLQRCTFPSVGTDPDTGGAPSGSPGAASALEATAAGGRPAVGATVSAAGRQAMPGRNHTVGQHHATRPHDTAGQQASAGPHDSVGETGSLDVAVSGGPDSTALLALALATGAPVNVHHVDHGLRPSSVDDAGFVEELSAHWGASFVVHRVTVTEGGDLERRCREARLSVLPPGCLTGHTADDQAETVLLRLMRGTGPVGLAAMDPATHPLLGLRRSETVALCEVLGVRPVRDPMNDSERFTRNRVRGELLPLMEDIAGRDCVPLLARTAELAAGAAASVRSLAAEVDPTDAREVAAATPTVAAEALRDWWRSETGGLLPPDRAAMDRMIEVARGTHRSAQLGAGWTLRRRAGRLWLEAPVTGPGREG